MRNTASINEYGFIIAKTSRIWWLKSAVCIRKRVRRHGIYYLNLTIADTCPPTHDRAFLISGFWKGPPQAAIYDRGGLIKRKALGPFPRGISKTLRMVPVAQFEHRVISSPVNLSIISATLSAMIFGSFSESPNSFLHTYASHLLQANYDIRTIQELLGHSDVRTTMIYTHTIKSTTLKEAKSPLDFWKLNTEN